MSNVRVKICGLRRREDIDAAANAGAAYIGFVFFEHSPRGVTAEVARDLCFAAPAGLAKVGLVVDASDVFLDALTAQVPLDFLQLHGHETPQRVAEVKARYGLPVIKALGVSCAADLPQIMEHSLVADQLLIDAKAPNGSALPGGNGVAFDWRLIAGRRWLRPWMLAGGLDAENVAAAIRASGARQVDVSSGVEAVLGVKDPQKMAHFVKAAQSASQ